jgi:CheY-like chemotaxis protein
MLFYRQERIDHVAVDLTDLLDEVVNMCRGIFPRSIDIQHEVGAGLPAVLGNRTQLRQALANLCANARDAIALAGEGDHSIRLRAEATAPEAADAAAAGGSETVVRVDIADTGVGMDSATQERIFEPFYTTKEGGGPAGLGLAAAYGIIRDHGGWIGCESQPGVGTTMSIHLPTETTPSAVEVPRVSITEPTALPAAADLRPYRGDESVLVIADVDRFRKILDLMLERNGYQVHLGRDSKDGVNLFRHEHESIDLVVIALAQPSSAATVEDVLSQLLRIAPRARTLVVTARPEDASQWGAAAGVLLQPFNTYQLLKTVRGILDA